MCLELTEEEYENMLYEDGGDTYDNYKIIKPKHHSLTYYTMSGYGPINYLLRNWDIRQTTNLPRSIKSFQKKN